MKQNNAEFVGVELTDYNLRSLIAAVIYDAVTSLAKQITKERRGEWFDEREKEDCERFFSGKDYRIYADMIDLNISGKEVLQMIRHNPKRYYKNDRAARNKTAAGGGVAT